MQLILLSYNQTILFAYYFQVNADAGTGNEANGDAKSSSQKLRPKLENSRDPEHTIGPVGQVIFFCFTIEAPRYVYPGKLLLESSWRSYEV